MKFRDIVNPIIKWWWLVLLATLIAAGSAYMVMKPKPPIYQAKVTLLVGRALFSPNPSDAQITITTNLAEYYADLASRGPVRSAVMSTLNLTALPDYVAVAVPDSARIQISVTDVSPQRAQAVANELANQLIKVSPTGTLQQDKSRLDFINQQLDSLQTQIKQVQADINSRSDAIKTMTSAAQIADAQSEIDTLTTKLNILQNDYSTLLDNSQQGAVNSLTVLEPASLPVKPIGPNKPAIIGLVTLIGLALSAGTANLLEYLDKSIKTPEDAERIMELPVLGYIGDITGKNPWSYVAEHPRSPVAEAFRSLRTNIEFASVDQPMKTLMVASSDTSEGKTTMATNLALSMAQNEKKVVLIDSDLRRPSVHKLFNLPMAPGLTDVFRDKVTLLDVLHPWKDRRLAVITAGNIPPNPTELLGSHKMETIMNDLKDIADTIILDAAPFLVADAAVMAKKVDGVILVIRSGQTRIDQAKDMLEQLRRSGAHVLGLVMNGLPRRGGYYSYRYYASYSNMTPSDPDQMDNPPTTPRNKKLQPTSNHTGEGTN